MAEPTTSPLTMQPEPTTAECRELRRELRVKNAELRRRTGYGATRIARVLNDRETSQPLVNAVHAALLDIRDELAAAGGNRKAMDRLDAAESRAPRPTPLFSDPTPDGTGSSPRAAAATSAT